MSLVLQDPQVIKFFDRKVCAGPTSVARAGGALQQLQWAFISMYQRQHTVHHKQTTALLSCTTAMHHHHHPPATTSLTHTHIHPG